MPATRSRDSKIRRHLIWLGYHSYDEQLRRMTDRANQLDAALATPPVNGHGARCLRQKNAVTSATSGLGQVLHRPGQNTELISLWIGKHSPRRV